MKQTSTPNLFAMAKDATKTKTAKVKGKPEVRIDAKYGKQIARFIELKAQAETIKSEMAVIEGTLKGVGSEKFLEKYNIDQSKPDNFKLVAELQHILFMVADRYVTVDDEKAEILKAEFPGAVETVTEYTLDNETLARCGAAVSEAIMNCKKISAEDKATLLVRTETVRVPKGTIEKLIQIGGKNFRRLFNLISPVCSLKVTA